MKTRELALSFIFGACWTLCWGALSALNLLPEERLMMDASNADYKLPHHFRTTDNIVPKTDSAGLKELHIAGSGQFSEKGLKTALQKIQREGDCYIVDLRQECHGYVDGIAISWYASHNAENFGKSLPDIEQMEKMRIDRLRELKEVLLHTSKPGSNSHGAPFQVEVKSANTEEELSRKLGLKYTRIPVTDHLHPEIPVVDRFVAFAKSIQPGTWLYFHCRGGDGRTSTFMAMYDMMHNAKKVSFKDIIERQFKLGGHNLADIPKKFTWHAYRKLERYKFLKKFYKYCVASDEKFSKSYSEWLQS